MNPEVKELWVSALRSGDFSQGKNLLHKTFPNDPEKADEYCCLGVLCAIAVQNGVISEEDVTKHSIDEEYDYFGYADGTAFLPTPVQKWSGVESDNGEYNDNDDDGVYRPRSLVFLNDDGIPFENIANVIEEKF